MTGRLDGMAAYIQGKPRTKGDAVLAMKFQTLFKTPG
jgi:putative sterol carrier protein